MDALKDFTQKDMIEQITILDEIKEAGQVEALPWLLELHASPLGDQAVDEMVYHTVFDLLAGQEKEIVAGLRHASEAVRLLCIRRAGFDVADAVKPALIDLLGSRDDPEIVGELIRALGSFRDSGLVDLFLPYLQHEDYTVAAWAMWALAGIGGPEVRDVLMDLVEKSDALKPGAGECDLRIALAVENLAKFLDEKNIKFLISHIHNPNPSFRRVVISTLISMGEAVLPALETCIEKGDRDEKVMAANIMGFVGDKKGADILVAQLEKGPEPNLRFAIYEGLGRINSMRSVIGLSDGLGEEDELVLIAVITGLDHLCNPGVVKILNETLDRKDAQSGRVLKALVTARSVQLFSSLYNDGRHAETLIDALAESKDQEAVAIFRGQLENMEGDKAATDMARLGVKEEGIAERRILAADDSKAMLAFYKGIAAELGMDLVTVEDGRQAFDYLQSDSDFDLIITDMNMPNMDGIELTREVRKREDWTGLPILMATTESEESQVDLASRAGVTDFIVKPFTQDDFKVKIEQMFG